MVYAKSDSFFFFFDCFRNIIFIFTLVFWILRFIRRTVQWSGEYRAGFTLIYYRREGELEEVHIPGPSLEDLRFLVSLFIFLSFFLSCLDFTRLLMRENWRWITDTFFVRSSCSERRMRVWVTSTPLPMRTLPGRQNSDGSTWIGPSVRPPVEVERRYKLMRK